MEEELNSSLGYTPTWIVAGVCSVIVIISLGVERSLHRFGKYLSRKKLQALYEALQKLKEELMLLGFISLLLTVSQGLISHICIPSHLTLYMLPCKRHTAPSHGSESEKHDQNYYQVIINRRRLLSEGNSSEHCMNKGKVPLLSLEALHQLHIFIFVLAVVHAIFCVTTLLLGGVRIRQWKTWEDAIRKEISKAKNDQSKTDKIQTFHHHEFFKEHAEGYWKKAAVISWLISFFKQFYGSVTESDYIALRQGFIKEHCPNNPEFDFHKYMLRTLEVDFKKIVGISWYLWLFVVVFLLLNLEGWHSYFWLAFLPLILLLLVGTKLEHVIARLAQESPGKQVEENQPSPQVTARGRKHQEAKRVKPSDEFFWFNRPALVLDLIHFILFQNSYEIAFFFWIWTTYGFTSCIMEKVAFIIPRLIMGVLVQVLCSYSTLPLYTIVTQMGSSFKKGMFDPKLESTLKNWGELKGRDLESSEGRQNIINKMDKELCQLDDQLEQTTIFIEGVTTSNVQFSYVDQHSSSER